MKAYKNHIGTSESVVICFSDGSMTPIPKENPMYKTVVGLLAKHKYSEVVDAVDVASKIKKASNGKFYVVDGLVWIDGESLPDTLSKRLIGFAEANIPTGSLEKFWMSLKANPSLRSREHLYAFLDHNNIPLTEDGCFIAYKRVDENYKDCYSHSFDNSVGSKVTMDRAKVDANPDQTCSRGLHVAAFPYAKDFYSNGHLMEVKVNPMDVVAVPNDYNGQKMRVCAYEVMAECDGPRPDAELLYNYDETADVDNWDDEEDICPDCGEVISDCTCDYYDGWDDDDWDDDDWDDGNATVTKPTVVKAVTSVKTSAPNTAVSTNIVTVTVDSRGRVGVPVRFIRSLGLSSGETVGANAVNGQVTLTLNSGDRDYTVDKDDAVRVTAYVLDLAGLGHRKTVKVTLDGKRIVLS